MKSNSVKWAIPLDIVSVKQDKQLFTISITIKIGAITPKGIFGIMSRLFYKVKKQTCPAIPVTNSAEDVLYPDALRRLICKK